MIKELLLIAGHLDLLLDSLRSQGNTNIMTHTCLRTVISDSVLLPEPPCYTLVTCSKHCHHPTSHVHPMHEYIHHKKQNHTLANDYSMLSQSVLSLFMKMSMPLAATRGILVCDGTNRTLLELTTQTRTQQLPEALSSTSQTCSWYR